MHKWAVTIVRYYHPEQENAIMTNEGRWKTFIEELKAYVEEHHHFPNKHTSMLNAIKYTRKIHSTSSGTAK